MRRLDRMVAWLGLKPARMRSHQYEAAPLGPEDLPGKLFHPPAPSKTPPTPSPRTGLIISVICLCISLALTLLMWCTHIFDNSVLKLVSIRNDLDLIFDLWRLPPTRPLLAVYIFNYTNTEMSLKGHELPRVQELGPYVFRERMERINIAFHDNGTVSFQENRTLTFQPELSSGPLNATVRIPNVPLLVMLNKIKNLDFIHQKGTAQLFEYFRVKPFQDVSIQEFIWGYEDELYQMTRKLQSFFKGEDEPKYGYLAKRNGVHHSVVTMKTGFPDLDQVGTITVYDGSDNIGIWGDSKCDDLRGSDGSLFPGNKVNRKMPLYIYAHEMCRRLPIRFAKATKTVDGFPVHQYNIPDNIFDFSSDNTENKCYKYENEYPPTGSFYTGPCQKGSPIYITFPHFWNGGNALQNSIHGLNPDPEKHRSSFLLHERLGVCLRARSRFQMNVRLHKARHIEQFPGIKDGTILPFAWTEYDSGPLPDHFKDIVYHLTYTVRTVQVVLKWIFLISFFLSAYFFYTQIKGSPIFLIIQAL